MPKIISIKDLKKANELSQMCKDAEEPIFITKNGCCDMVIMSMEVYEKKMHMLDVYDKLNAAEEQVQQGKVFDADYALKRIRKRTSKLLQN